MQITESLRKVTFSPLGSPGEDGRRPLYPIGVVADLLGVTDQTLRLYEVQGLVKPARRRGERYYSGKDLRWLQCLRYLIHGEKVSIEGVRRLLRFAPCWEITGFREEGICDDCPVFRDHKAQGGDNGRRRGPRDRHRATLPAGRPPWSGALGVLPRR